MPNEFDVIVCGAGMVGLTLARALLRGGLRVALVEAGPRPRRQALAGTDPRVFALTRASEWIFRNLGAWDAMSAQRVSPFREMHVWDAAGSIHFDSADLGEAYLGHIVELQVIRNALLDVVDGADGLYWYTGASPVDFLRTADAIQITLDDGHALRAALLVGADGGDSRVRDLAHIHCEIRDYGHHALVATVRSELPHAETAWQHFLGDGPLAFLPLNEPHTSSIVWSTAPQQAQVLLGLDPAAFHAQLEDAFEGKLGRIESSADRTVFPLVRRHAHNYVQERIALVGDAAHTIHPLAGQGVNLGLLDAASLAEVCLAAHAKRRDLGAYPLLRRYERWRKGDNQAMLWLMDGFKTLFSSRLPGVPLLRNLGLNLTNAAGPVKHLLMRRAMGQEGDLPELAQARFDESDEITANGANFTN